MLITLPARKFAAAWHNVALAASDDPERHPLYRSVLIDVHHDHEAVRLAATDSYIAFTAIVDQFEPDEDDECLAAGIECIANDTIVVADYDKRAAALMAWLLKATKDEDEIPVDRRRTITLRTESMEPSTTPTLDPSLDRLHLVIDAGDEALALPILETEKYAGPYPLILAHTGGEVAHLALDATILGRVAKFKESVCSIDLEFGEDSGKAARFTVRGWPTVTGLVMPIIRQAAEVETVDAERSDFLRNGSGVHVGGGAA